MWILTVILSVIGLAIFTVLLLIFKKISILTSSQISIKSENFIETHEELKPHDVIGLFNSVNKIEDPIDTKGDLIPSNLTESEKEILRMFYNQ